VRRQAQLAGIGMPEVAVYDAPEINAFATGMSRNNALVAVSSGLLAGMSRDEAEAVLAQCRPWTPVEHLIIFNVEGLDKAGAETMMAEGRRVLSVIPGVREVFTGEAVKEDAKYRYTWLVRFCHPAVIGSYREHPDHIAFANNLFRPVAGERISIDYHMVEEAT
jgi:fructose-bisphosphate aldolase class II